jgi:hypothetical protein
MRAKVKVERADKAFRRQELEFRATVVKQLWRFTAIWTIVMTVVVVGSIFLNAANKTANGISVPHFLTFIASTVVNFIGLYAIIVRHLFPSSPRGKNLHR